VVVFSMPSTGKPDMVSGIPEQLDLLTFLMESADRQNSRHNCRMVDRILRAYAQLLIDRCAQCFLCVTWKPYLPCPGKALGPEGSDKEKKGIQSFSLGANVMINVFNS
jgi:hypothetical protein